MEECLFCRIVKGEIPSEKIYEDEKVYAFSDVDPKAPVHVLIVPKEHMADVTDPRAVRWRAVCCPLCRQSQSNLG